MRNAANEHRYYLFSFLWLIFNIASAALSASFGADANAFLLHILLEMKAISIRSQSV